MTKKTKSQIYIGTSGWIYSSWKKIFYPENLPSRDRLKYFSTHFKTTEVNYSFYHLPRPSTYKNWYTKTPKDFVFAVKASRFITHIKRLKGIKAAWKKFLENALHLKEKLGPILFQLPPSFKAIDENIKRLEKFISEIKKINSKLRYAFEFRHPSWCSPRIYNLLKKYNVAWVIADSSRYSKTEECTADFVYIRMHGPKELFGSKYTDKQLKELSKLIKKYSNQGKDIYVYFNNDFHGYAVENAKTLMKFLKLK